MEAENGLQILNYIEEKYGLKKLTKASDQDRVLDVLQWWLEKSQRTNQPKKKQKQPKETTKTKKREEKPPVVCCCTPTLPDTQSCWDPICSNGGKFCLGLCDNGVQSIHEDACPCSCYTTSGNELLEPGEVVDDTESAGSEAEAEF